MSIYCLTLSTIYKSNYLSLLPPLILQFTNVADLSPAWQECGGTDYVLNKKAHVLSVQLLGSWQSLTLIYAIGPYIMFDFEKYYQTIMMIIMFSIFFIMKKVCIGFEIHKGFMKDQCCASSKCTQLDNAETEHCWQMILQKSNVSRK